MGWFGWTGWLHVMILVVFDAFGDMSVRCVSQCRVLIWARGAHPLLFWGTCGVSGLGEGCVFLSGEVWGALELGAIWSMGVT